MVQKQHVRVLVVHGWTRADEDGGGRLNEKREVVGGDKIARM